MKLSKIDLNDKDNMVINYDNIVRFKRDIYNFDNRERYNRIFNLYFDLVHFNMKLLDYKKYQIRRFLIKISMKILRKIYYQIH